MTLGNVLRGRVEAYTSIVKYMEMHMIVDVWAQVTTERFAGQPMRQNQVAATLGLNESAVTAMVTRLVKQGLLTRARSEADSRAFDLTLTPAGDAALKATEAPFAEVNALIDAALGPDTDAAAKGLRALSDRLSGG